MADVRFRHAAALALVGWYLMTPPTGEHLDSSCSFVPSMLDSVIAFITSESQSDRIKRCYAEARVLILKAPLSKWYQEDEFETLVYCRNTRQTYRKPRTYYLSMAPVLSLTVQMLFRTCRITICSKYRRWQHLIPDASPPTIRGYDEKVRRVSAYNVILVAWSRHDD